MKIEALQIQQFKRFTHLTIGNIPETARLVMLVGPNGSGKTSLFEAFNYWSGPIKHRQHFDGDYHPKVGSDVDTSNGWFDILNRIKIKFYDGVIDPTRDQSEKAKKLFYIRGPYRHEADFHSYYSGQPNDFLEDS